MTFTRSLSPRPARLLVSTVSCIALLAGCNSTSPVNNKLRAENLKLQEDLTALKRQIAGDVAQIHTLEKQRGTLPTLPQDRLARLFTVSGIQLGRLTGGERWDSSKEGDTGLKVVVVPIDVQGEKLKAAGSFSIDAFDLAAAEPHIGHWAFDVEQSKASWYGGGLLYTYSFKCPWQKVPAHGELTVKVTFVDELTQREFSAQMVCKANPPKTPNAK